MATTHRSDLVDELEKALRDEAYDGGMGALMQEQFTDYVRGLAVTAAKVVEEAHTPTDDERKALLTEADTLVASWDQKGSWSSDSPVGMVMRLAAALRRAEVPEPSAEHAYKLSRDGLRGVHDPDTDWNFGYYYEAKRVEGNRRYFTACGEVNCGWESGIHTLDLVAKDLVAHYLETHGMPAALRAAGGAR